MSENYFVKLSQVKCVIEKKKELSYVSWADAWAEVKKIHPDATYEIYENAEGFPFWESFFGIDVKVGVTINNLEHVVRLPVMDGANKAMKRESYKYKTKFGEKTCDAADAFDINKAIQRAFAKAIAMHGIGLYVYRGEDLPTIIEDSKLEPVEEELLDSDRVDLTKAIELQIEVATTLDELRTAFEYAKEIKSDLGQENMTFITGLVKNKKITLEATQVFDSPPEDEEIKEDENQITVEGYIEEVKGLEPPEIPSNEAGSEERMIEDLKKKKEALKSKTNA